MLRLTAVLALALVLCQCGTPSPPQCLRPPRESHETVRHHLETARQAWQRAGSAENETARTQAAADYNLALARLFEHLRCGTGGFHDRAAKLGTTIDTSRSLGAGLHLDDLDALLTASSISTKAIGKRHTVAGLGLPVVGWKKTSEKGDRRWDFAPPTGIPLNLTAVLHFPPGKTPQWIFHHPAHVQSIPIGRREVPLAADWSAPSAFYWRMSDLDDLDLEKVFLPSRFSEETALHIATPYKPQLIPLVFIHGLYSSPGTYKRLYNELNREPWFRENYQVWFFSYPTGNNWMYSAARFREEMARATKFVRSQGPAPNWNNMVLVGHSMGGVIAHASLKRPERKFYDAFATLPLDELKVNRQTHEAIRLMTEYEPLEAPSRVIFLAAPHRGSPLADRMFSSIFVRLIRLPKQLSIDFVDFTLNDFAGLTMKGPKPTKGWFTSIGSLSPKYPTYKVLDQLPFRPGLKRHSIIGDRGRGDTPDSSDGVVPYWSSHLGGVDSETVVPANHSVTVCPECAVELKRILQLHLKETRD